MNTTPIEERESQASALMSPLFRLMPSSGRSCRNAKPLLNLGCQKLA